MYAGRIIWMVPPPEQPSCQDAHIAVANPDDAQHPEDNHPPTPHTGPLPSAQDSAGAVAACGQTDPSAGYESGSRKAGGAQTDWQRQPILLDVQKECFSRLLLLPEILMDHLPDTYLAAVQQL